MSVHLDVKTSIQTPAALKPVGGDFQRRGTDAKHLGGVHRKKKGFPEFAGNVRKDGSQNVSLAPPGGWLQYMKILLNTI